MKTKNVSIKKLLSVLAAGALLISFSARAEDSPEIRTPAAPSTPRINGPEIFGVRPDHPFLYHIPATGDRPMEFSADKLPKGLTLDAATGNITGTLQKNGEYTITFHAKNSLGASSKKFKIVVGETIDLTPAMGWNSWNHYAGRITQEIVLQNAKAMPASSITAGLTSTLTTPGRASAREKTSRFRATRNFPTCRECATRFTRWG
jgi:alpha-galactosidase